MTGRFIIGVDVGGTFTDVLCLALETGKLRSAKVLSNVGEQWRGVLSSLRALSIPFEDIEVFVHGTTIATNALLERKGATTALVTTKGFKDAIEIGKTRRLVGGLFDCEFQRPKPVVHRRHRFEVEERIDSTGETLVELSESDLRDIARAIMDQELKSVAIGFVNSYLSDRHEKKARAYLESALPPEVPICTSSEISRERGEFERFSTATVNAYLAPTIAAYLDKLSDELSSRRIAAQVQIMSSNGGFLSLSSARRFPVRTFLSGPVGGVIGAKQIAALSAVTNFITFDMGGTSTDVALIAGSMPTVSYANLVDAYPLQTPQLDIHTIGAGGGSIARLGDDGSLDVGPESAGAQPGPAAYQRGGSDATITDANVVLGRLPIREPLGSAITLSKLAAEESLERMISTRFSHQGIVKLAEGIIKIAVLKMAGAVREVSVHRGHDPRDFHLVGFGGAGPMHVFLVAEELGVSKVLIPRFPGHLSAMGQILADSVIHLAHPFAGSFDRVDETQIKSVIEILRGEAAKQFDSDNHVQANYDAIFHADVRYRGQSFVLPVGIDVLDITRDVIERAFHAAHESTFGHSSKTTPTEIVNLRLTATLKRTLPNIEFNEVTHSTNTSNQTQSYWDGQWLPTMIVNRDQLSVNYSAEGPLIIEEQGSTTVVPPGWRVRVELHGNILCERIKARAEQLLESVQ